VPGTKASWNYEELLNLECLYASHNLIKDIFGICQLTTIRELNLSFNMIVDISPIEELDLLEKLFLNRNKIQIVEPLKKLTSLQTVGLFHNDIFNAESSMEVFVYLGTKYRLREISIDANPISSTTRFRQQLIMNIPKLEMLDDD
jgi:Leucine-rich repeat (LRR) protein